jgi:hypothetical protein
MTAGKQQPGQAPLAIVLMVVCVGLAACGGSTNSQDKGASAGAGSAETGPLRPGSNVKQASTGPSASSTGPLSTAVGGQSANGRSRPVQAGASKTAAVREALTKFAACLHQRGVDVPISQNSRSGAALNIKGIDTGATRFKAAWAKCRGAVDVGRVFHKLQAGLRSAT